MELNWEKLYWLGSTGSNIISLISYSHGLRQYARQCIQEGSSRENRKFISIDAQCFISTPQLWFQLINSKTQKKSSVRAVNNSLKDSIQLPDNTVVFIDNAVDFMMLSRYPDHQNFIDEFNSVASKCRRNNCCWILGWKSSSEIPQKLNSRIFQLSPWNTDIINGHLESKNINLSSEIIQTIWDLTGGYPEYIDPISNIATKTQAPNQLTESIRQTLKNKSSLLSTLCLLKWTEILNQARGYASLKALLTVLAFNPDSRLSEIAQLISTSAPAVKDYLTALMNVGAISKFKGM